jgi:hypothetical protein
LLYDSLSPRDVGVWAYQVALRLPSIAVYEDGVLNIDAANFVEGNEALFGSELSSQAIRPVKNDKTP